MFQHPAPVQRACRWCASNAGVFRTIHHCKSCPAPICHLIALLVATSLYMSAADNPKAVLRWIQSWNMYNTGYRQNPYLHRRKTRIKNYTHTPREHQGHNHHTRQFGFLRTMKTERKSKTGREKLPEKISCQFFRGINPNHLGSQKIPIVPVFSLRRTPSGAKGNVVNFDGFSKADCCGYQWAWSPAESRFQRGMAMSGN